MPHHTAGSPWWHGVSEPRSVMQERVFFRVDADDRIGSGHLVRCRLLADALRRHAVPSTFLTTSTPEILCNFIEGCGHTVTRLPADRAADPGYLLEEIGGAGAGSSMLVLDGDVPEFYETRWHETIRARDVGLMIITFRHDCHFAADLVLNQNLLALRQQYSAEPHAELLLGPRYAVLAEEFRELNDMPTRVQSRPRSILVTFGGADRQDLTLRTVRALSKLKDPPERLLVVAGSLYSRLPELEALLSASPHLNPELQVDTMRMPAVMSEADLAVTSGGITAWELACAGVPNVIVSSSERERWTGLLLGRERLACFVGHYDEVSQDQIRKAVEHLMADAARRQSLSLAGRQLVDGRGLDRVLEKMLALLRKEA